jgi:hypothetical protein
MPATVSARWLVRGTNLRLRRLRLAKLPARARVRLRCAGRRCSFRRRTVAGPRGRSLDLRRALGRAATRLRAGQTLEVLVTAHAYDGKLFRWRLRSGRVPRLATRCIPLGSTKPRRRC